MHSQIGTLWLPCHAFGDLYPMISFYRNPGDVPYLPLANLFINRVHLESSLNWMFCPWKWIQTFKISTVSQNWTTFEVNPNEMKQWNLLLRLGTEILWRMRLTYIYFLKAFTQGSHDFRFDMGRMGIRAGKLTSPEFFDGSTCAQYVWELW